MCKKVTHFSSTQIPSCQTQNSCYEKVDGVIKTHELLPKHINNQINHYKNYVGSSVYYFNESKKDVDKIHSFCSDFIDPSVIFNVNDFFFNIRNIFFYLDQTNIKSIELLTEYASYLQTQEIELITEEDLFLDYALINENINEIKQESSNNNYINNLKKSSKEANELAEKFGFSESYLSRLNFTNLISYYLKINEEVNPEKELEVPIFSNSIGFIVYRIANYENLKRINLRLINTDTYNLYLFLDKTIGFEKSNFVEFSELNNRFIENLEKISLKINQLEKEIEENLEYLNLEKKNNYFQLKEKYRTEKIGFGRYLYNLKEIKIEIEENKEITKINNLEKANKIENCEREIKKIETENYFLLDLIEKYNLESNYLKKIEICNNILLNYDVDECITKLRKLKEENVDYDIDLENITEKNCKEIIFNINRFLENNEKITLFNELILEIEKRITEIKKFEVDSKTELALIKYTEEIEQERKKANSEKIIEIEEKIKEYEEKKEDLKKILKTEIEKDFFNNAKINYIEEEYYLCYFNKTIFAFENVCCNNRYSNIASKANTLKITTTNICADKIYSANNCYKISYENQKEIETKILEITLNKSLFESIVKNQVIGILDSLNLGQVELIDRQNYYFDGTKVHYLTKEQNKILYYKRLFEYFVDREIIEILDDILIIKEEWVIKNTSEQNIDSELKLFEIDQEEITIKEEGRKINHTIKNNWVYITEEINKGQEKKYTINKLITIEKAKEVGEKIVSNLYLLRNSQFLEIKEQAEKIALEIDLENIVDVNIENLEKIINKKEEVEILKEKEENFLVSLTNYEILKTELKEKYLNNTEIEEELSKLDQEKYLDPNKVLETLNEFITDFEEKTELEKEQNFEENNKKITEIKEKLTEFDLLTLETISEISELDLTSDISKNLENFNKKISKKEEELANENKELILEFEKEIEDYELYETLEKARTEFEGITLTELYDSNIIPPFTLQDIERFEKKIKFKDTISFGKEIDSFNDAFFTEDYATANKKLTKSTITKMNEVLIEKTIFTEGLENIKKNTKKEYEKLSKNLSEEQKEEIELLIEQDRDLLALYLLKNQKIKEKTEITKTTQIIVILVIIALFYLAYLFYNKKTPTITKEEKKRRIIRKY